MKKALLGCVLLLAFGGAGRSVAADDPAVVRVRTDSSDGSGVAFFLPARTRSGVAAVGTAHNARLEQLVGAKRVQFLLGASQKPVGVSVALLAPPGLPFNAPGGSLAGDYVVYALAGAPVGVRLLELSDREPKVGDEVRLYGIPRGNARNEVRIDGKVTTVTPGKIEVDLEAPYDLRGWGGAPVVTEKGAVVGMLQAHVPRGDTSRVIASPVGELAVALQSPLANGTGLAFREFAKEVQEASAARPAPKRSNGDSRRKRSDLDSRLPGPLIRQERDSRTRVHLDVEFPAHNSTVSDSVCGTFIAGRALALQGDMRRFDVMIVIDTSRSTADPTGADINGNGVVGKPRLGRIGSMFDAGSTDPGDSILAAEVAAARQLLRGLDPRSTRIGVVVFSGDTPASGGLFPRRPPPPAVTLQPLTTDYDAVQSALDEIVGRDPAGQTHMAAGVDQATIELLGLSGALSRTDPDSEKVVFFFTDGQPTLPYGPGYEADNVRAVLRAASRANRGAIRIHSFAIGPDALDGPVATVEMASRTEGYFTPVRHPADLINVVEEVSFANLDHISVKSVTTGDEAHPFRSTADGAWGGFLKMVPGKNEIEINARADDGTQTKKTLLVTFEPEAPDPMIPESLVVQRNRLLEDCLVEIKKLRLEAEEEHAEEVRKSLLVEIEQERAKAREKAAEQRKRLDIGIEEQ